ncbi:MAG: tetratricopeptide repeat protein, partial [Prevotella sp.]|nr:tetratricopeptide repeat protein [Prevotella sp.]
MRRPCHTFLILLALLVSITTGAQTVDYQHDQTYISLRKDMTRGFNEADSATFYPALQKLEDYLLEKGDMHGYYTQRCNEIIFLMNRQKIFEAYKRAREMSQELREKQLDKEMYMAYNMLGHIYRYCGNKESARRCFRDVISRMEQAGYYESMPPIYMNIVNVEISDNPEEAMHLLEKAIEIARQYSPERVFDIEAR